MNNKYTKLGLGILFDAIGFFTIMPLDLIWAPLSGFLMTKMYKGKIGKIAGIISFIEEIIPFSDVIPTFTIMWVYTYLIEKEDTKNKDVIIDV